MTIKEFMRNNGLKNRSTVEKWINDELIPNASIENDYIPNSARVPYTKARAKKAESIYRSILKACRERKHVLPQIYKMSSEEFNQYINQLENAGLINKRTEDGVEYYDISLYALKLQKEEINKIIVTISNFAVAVSNVCSSLI